MLYALLMNRRETTLQRRLGKSGDLLGIMQAA